MIWRWGGALLTVWVLFASAPAVASAQQSTPTDSTRRAEADSAQARIRERLRRLDRPAGYDSVLFVQDSVRLAEAASGVRPSASSRDTVVAELLSMPGFVLTEYEAEHANFETARRILELRAPEDGRALVIREGMRVEADTSITFDESSGLMRTVGDATFSPPEGDPVSSASLVYDLDQARGSAFDAETEFTEGGTKWIVRGDMPYAAPDSSYMSHARFTSCDLDEPHYHFETDQIKIVGGKVLVARGVRLYFQDVPVAWLPFIAQGLGSGRQSGLLTPRFSVNDIVRTSGGYKRRLSNVGFYWAMGDYSDALMAIDWFSDNFLSLTSSLQYRFNQQFLNGNLNFRRYWKEDGGTELSLDTRHSWDVDERTQMRVSGRFSSDNDFVRDYSFDPREVTQSIDSDGGFSRRFDWGSLNFAANRRQYLSDDRIEWTLPSASLSLSSITLFRAPSSDARFWNNMTWSGNSQFSRSTVDRLRPDTFAISTASSVNQSAQVRSSLGIGNLSWGQSASLREASTLGIPEAFLIAQPGDTIDPTQLLAGAPARDVTRSELTWSSSLGYQQQLIGSTTITPSLTVSGNLARSDTSTLSSGFVSAPMRASLGASLKTDIYGFFPGFGSFDAIRHKVSPSFTYQWSPSSTPNQLQSQFFGARALQPQNALAVTLNQTWEARRSTSEEGPVGGAPGAESGDSLGLTELTAAPAARGGEPRRAAQAQTVKLLGITTSVVRYDFVEADSAGSFLAGFETTRLANTISSDYLRGLSVSMGHELFDDQTTDGVLDRRFDPFLSQLNLSFALGSNSALFRWLGLAGGGADAEEEQAVDEGVDDAAGDPFGDPLQGATDESSMIPNGASTRGPAGPARSGGRRGWNANLSYSLQRSRSEGSIPSQMLSGSVTLYPTENWDLTWRTAYDLERRAFNDHIIRLSRDLHRWQANFDFLQTATGNWSFRFHVSLTDNRDLKFDYEQRNLDVGLPPDQRRIGS